MTSALSARQNFEKDRLGLCQRTGDIVESTINGASIRGRAEEGQGRWVVCQIGAREHYVLAAELYARGRLAALVTDAWASPASNTKRLARLTGHGQLGERYLPTLADARVVSMPAFAQVLHGVYRAVRPGWRGIMEANRRFGSWAARQLTRRNLLGAGPDGAGTVFAYSYAALEILQAARAQGCRTVLGQIDPGPADENIITQLVIAHGLPEKDAGRAPVGYWNRWREECALADVILANSTWSAKLLAEAGVPPGKLRIAPLAYSRQLAITSREYPQAFTRQRPLRLLFLGNVSARKGIFELVAAMKRLREAPVHLKIVGPIHLDVSQIRDCVTQIEWVGPVPRSATADYYRQVDAFILPTHSDGFALTQLEAQADGLPLIVSRHCGDVVSDGETGFVIEQVTPEAIEAAIRRALKAPAMLAEMSRRAPLRAATFVPSVVVDGILDAVEAAT